MRVFRKIIGVVLLILTFVQGAECQKNMIFRFSNDFQYGFDLNKSGHPMTVASEFAVDLPMYGDWNHDYTYNFPTIGFAITPMWTQLDDKGSKLQERGKYDAPNSAWTVGSYSYFLWPFVHTPRFAANIKLGAGFALYPTKLFDKNTWRNDGKPYAVATRYMTNLVTGGLDFHIRLGKKYGKPLYQWELSFGGEGYLINSFGLNRSTESKEIVTFHLGAKYTPNVWALPIRKPARKVHRVWQLDFALMGGFNQLTASDWNRFYPCGTFTAGIHLPLSNAFRLGVCADYFVNTAYDGTQREDFVRYNFIDEKRYKYMQKVGLCLSHELTYYKFAVSLDVGAYVFNPIKVPKEDENGNENVRYKFENLIYGKLTTKYHFSKNWYAVARLKTSYHFENVESGIGFTIPDWGDRLKNPNPFKRLKNPFKRKEDYTEEKIEGQRNKYYTPRVYPFKQ